MRLRRTDIPGIGIAIAFGLAASLLGSAPALARGATAAPAVPTPAGFGAPVKVKNGSFTDVSEVVDTNNHIHLAVSDSVDVWYLTDRTGSWTSTKVFKHTGTVLWGQPSIAIDEHNRVHIAATRFPYGEGDIGIFYATDVGHPRGTFGVPTRIAPNGNGEPQIKVRDGKLFLVDVKGWCCVGDGIVQMRTNVTGSWTVATIGAGQDPSFRMTSDGFARVAYDRGDTSPGIYLGVASTHAGSFVKGKIPGTGQNDSRPILGLKGNEAQIVWTHSGTPGRFDYTYATPSGWHSFLTVPGSTSSEVAGFDVSTTGVAHVAIGGTSVTDAFRSAGTWHSGMVATGTDVSSIALRRGLTGSVAVAWVDGGGGVWVART